MLFLLISEAIFVTAILLLSLLNFILSLRIDTEWRQSWPQAGQEIEQQLERLSLATGGLTTTGASQSVQASENNSQAEQPAALTQAADSGLAYAGSTGDAKNGADSATQLNKDIV